jgi:vitamin B12 transporter
LQPEESVSYEMGIEYNGAVQLSTALFQTDIDQLITYSAARRQPVNVSQARIIGQEFGARWAVQEWLMSGQLTVLDTQNRDLGSQYGNVLPRRPRTSMAWDVERRWQTWSAGVQLNTNSHRYDDLANNARLGGYTLLNLRLSQQLSAAWQLQASVDNVADKVYETAEYFNQAGRAVWLTVRYQDDQ